MTGDMGRRRMDHKIALSTGAASGIERATAVLLTPRGRRRVFYRHRC